MRNRPAIVFPCADSSCHTGSFRQRQKTRKSVYHVLGTKCIPCAGLDRDSSRRVFLLGQRAHRSRDRQGAVGAAVAKGRLGGPREPQRPGLCPAGPIANRSAGYQPAPEPSRRGPHGISTVPLAVAICLPSASRATTRIKYGPLLTSKSLITVTPWVSRCSRFSSFSRSSTIF